MSRSYALKLEHGGLTGMHPGRPPSTPDKSQNGAPNEMTASRVQVDRPPNQPPGPGESSYTRRSLGRTRSLTADIADLERTRRRINTAVWGIAAGVMIYGAINVTGLLIDHGVWAHVAWLLSVMIDLAMCVGLMGDRVLHQYGRQDPWVTALRWATAVMTLILNTARPALAHDWVGVGIHTAGPVLLLLVAEAAGSFQRQLTAIIQDLETHLADAEHAVNPDDEVGHTRRDETRETMPVSPTTPPSRPSLATTSSAPLETPNRAAPPPTTLANGAPSLGATRDLDDSTPAETATAFGRVAQQTQVGTIETDTGRAVAQQEKINRPPDRDEAGDSGGPTTADATLTTREAMWEHWRSCRAAGHRVTGADLDRAFGTNNYGRRVIKEWIIAGRITHADVAAARLTATATAA